MKSAPENQAAVHKIKQTEEEIETIGKELYRKITAWVKAHPLLTLLFSFLLSVASNLVSQWIWNFFNENSLFPGV